MMKGKLLQPPGLLPLLLMLRASMWDVGVPLILAPQQPQLSCFKTMVVSFYRKKKYNHILDVAVLVSSSCLLIMRLGI